MALQTGSWAQLRQQIRSLESQTENLFHTYSQFASASSLPIEPTAEELQIEKDIHSILSQREDVLSSLSRQLDSEPLASQSAVKSSHISLHKSLLAQHNTTLSRIKSDISSARDRNNLLSSVRRDIASSRRANGANAEAEYMLDERSRLDNSHNMADGVLSQAYAVQEQFGLQKEALTRIHNKITGALGQVPGINGLMGQIGGKKRRDGIILASFIAFCFLMFWFFM